MAHAETVSRNGERPITVIEAQHGWVHLHLGELWTSRELLFYFVWRDLKVRYRQTFFGVAWAIIQPLLLTLIFSLIFSRVAGVAPGDTPYPLFVLSGLVPWLYFSQGLTLASNSLVAAEGIITKVYFPRLVLPLAAVCVPLVDFVLAFALLVLAAMLADGLVAGSLLFLPVMIVLALAATIGVGTILATVNVQYRDVRHALPFVVQLWFFASPIIYTTGLVPSPWGDLYALNPMVGVIEGFRWSLLGGPAPVTHVVMSGAVSGVILVGALLYFRRRERTFADVI